MLGNPAAARGLHDLLVAEGRRYADTPAGAQLRDALIASEAVENLRRVWETVSLNVLDGPAAPQCGTDRVGRAARRRGHRARPRRLHPRPPPPRGVRMTLTDPREALADQSSFISYLIGLAGLARVVHALAADGDRRADPSRDADDFVHVLLGLASLGDAIERLAESAPAQHHPAAAEPLVRLDRSRGGCDDRGARRSDFLRAPVLATAQPEGFKEWHHFVIHGADLHGS